MRRKEGKPGANAAADRQRLAMDMRSAGFTYQQIADQLGYASHTGAMKAVTTWIRRYRRECADDVVNIEDERLNRLLRAAWPKALTGDLNAINCCLNISARRAKLLAIDGTMRWDVSAEIRELALLFGFDPEKALDIAERFIEAKNLDHRR